MLLEREKSLVLLIDVQERLLPAMANGEECRRACSVLLRAAAELSVPALATLQYSRGLGALVDSLASLVPAQSRFEKMEFSCYENPTIRDALSRANQRQIVLAGMETHVCVLQSAEALLAADFQVFVVADAVASRRVENRDLALRRLERSGAVITSVEMVLFEWLRTAESGRFRSVSRMIR